MNIRMFITFLFVLPFLTMSGQESVVLKDGSEYIGRISNHDFSEKTITIRTDSAIVTEKLKDVYYSAPELTILADMPASWRVWFEAHPELVIQKNGNSCAWLGNISYIDKNKKGLDGQAIIKKVSKETVTFFTIAQTSMKFNKITEVDHYEYQLRDPLALVGTIDNIVLTDGSIKSGQIVADYPTNLVLKTQDGVETVISKTEIRSKRITPYNTNRDISEQEPYLSHITYTDGNNQLEAEGIIRETVYKPANGEEPYYEILDGEGRNPYRYRFSDVKRISLVFNRKYRKEKDVLLSGNDIMVANTIDEPIAFTVSNDGYRAPDSVDIIKVSLKDLKDNKLPVYYRENSINKNFIFVEAKLVKNDVKDAKSSKKKNEKTEDETYYSISFAEMLMKEISEDERFVSPIGNISVKYGNISEGHVYALIRKADQKGFLIEIVK